MGSFTPYEDRDAWFVIRGYVYQVHTTILEWLTLSPGCELWLECGEDIDRVQEGLSRSDTGDDRILEQIKHRQKAVPTKNSIRACPRAMEFALMSRTAWIQASVTSASCPRTQIEVVNTRFAPNNEVQAAIRS